MTIAEASRVLGLHHATVHRRLQSGVMRGERVHEKLWLIPREEVERFRGVGKLKRGPKPNRNKTCAACRVPFVAVGRGAYCGPICKQRAYRQRRREREQAGTDQLPAP